MIGQWFSEELGVDLQLIVGFLLGLIASVFTASINHVLSARRDKKHRSEEARAVERALLSEIVLVRKELVRTARLVIAADQREGGFPPDFLQRVQLQEPQLYAALASKLGLMKPSLLSVITQFYYNLELVRLWLPQISHPNDGSRRYHPLAVLDPALAAIDGVSLELKKFSDNDDFVLPQLEESVGNIREFVAAEHERLEA